MENPEEFERRIKQYIRAAGTTQKEVALELGYGIDTFNKWVRGINKMPFNAISRVCQHLGLTKEQKDELFVLAGYVEPPPMTPAPASGQVGGVGISVTPPTIRQREKPWNRWLRIGIPVVLVAVLILIAVVLLIRKPASGVLAQATGTPESKVCGEASRVTIVAPGLLRSQGVTDFTAENTQGAVFSNQVRALAFDEQGLWIGYFGDAANRAGGLGQYDKASWSICGSANVPTGNVNAVAIDQRGWVWVATESDGVAVFSGQMWRRFTTENGLPSNQTYSLTVDSNDNILVGTWEGIAKFDGEQWSVPYSVNNETIYNNHVHAVVYDSARNIWVGHISDGVSEYDNARGIWVHYEAGPGSIGGDKIRSIVVRPADDRLPESVWFATADAGVSKFEQGQWTVYRMADGLPSDTVTTLAVDRYGRVWAATMGGVAYFDGSDWITYHTLPAHTVAIGPTTCAECPFDGEHVWTGTLNRGLTHSRLPYPEQAVDVNEVCFVTDERERVCATLAPDPENPEIIIARYPDVLVPDEELRFEVTMTPREPYELREDRGDFLSALSDNDSDLLGAYPIIKALGTVSPGQPFTFTDHDNPLKAPHLPEGVTEMAYIVDWRLWMHTRYAGPVIRLIITVQNP